MLFFCLAIDPLLHSLNSQLTGFTRLTISLPGPVNEMESSPPQLKETLKLISYADDLKPVVHSLDEITFYIMECNKLELASGVQLHRNPMSGKVKILLLGDWKTTVSQDDIPFPFIKISDKLDCVGVSL